MPQNVSSRAALPDDPGWWGFSFRDVPERRNGETFRAVLPDCRVASLVDDAEEFRVAIVNRDDRAVALREMGFRPHHGPVLRSRPAVRLKRATWICERVYHNHSHWLTAHLPKLLLLQRRDELANVLLPERRLPLIDESLKLFGLEPDRFDTFEPGRLLAVDELTVLGTDRFRPELLRLVREACPVPTSRSPGRRVFVSRGKAARRRLVNEAEVWPILERAGFERVFMEDLTFKAQVTLMRNTVVLLGPHGAGLTNMIFCSPGTHVVEIADLGFPNPNFYAVASAMDLSYSVLAAEGQGDVPPLEKDLRIEPAEIEALLARLTEELAVQ